jgi:simple sugar transport system ATP-binding protein
VPATDGDRAALAVELRSIDKAFYGVKANDGVDFEVRWGEVHALLGENGAGKSTLCSILAGLYRPDDGELWLDGRKVSFRSPKDALDAGVGMVYQHFRLVDNLTVAENLALGHPDLGVRVSQARIERAARELGERYGLPIDPAARIWQLSVGEQQRVEILKLLYRNVRVLILDEPTAVLTPQEADVLFRTVRLMAAEGRSVIFVSHKLPEVKQVSDRVTVLRNGRREGQVDTAEAEPRDLARMMVGRDLDLPTRSEQSHFGEVVLSVKGLRIDSDRGLEAVRGVSFEIRGGEILGIAGVAGNGQTELAYGLAGLRRLTAGTVILDGEDVTGSDVRARISRGLGYVPQNRLGVGLAPGLTTEDNLALKSYRDPPFSRGPLLVQSAFSERAAEIIDHYDVRGVRPGLPIRLLSGGNLQKLLLGRELTQRPRVLIARSPTRGLDVGASEMVRHLLLEEREKGTGVLLISEDLDELLALADRLLVLFEGEFVGELTADDADAELLGLLMAGHREPDTTSPGATA